MTSTLVEDIIRHARAAGVQAVPRRARDGEVDEIALWDGGPTTGAVFRSSNGQLAVWVSTRRQLHVANAAEAISIIVGAP